MCYTNVKQYEAINKKRDTDTGGELLIILATIIAAFINGYLMMGQL